MRMAARVAPIGKGMGVAVLGVETRALGLATLAISVPLNGAFYTDITTNNTTGAAVTKDFAAIFGVYDAAAKKFTIYWAHLKTGVSIATGTATNTVNCVAKEVGIWDVLGAIGTFNAATGVFTIHSAMVLEDALIVAGVAVTGLTLRT